MRHFDSSQPHAHRLSLQTLGDLTEPEARACVTGCQRRMRSRWQASERGSPFLEASTQVLPKQSGPAGGASPRTWPGDSKQTIHRLDRLSTTVLVCVYILLEVIDCRDYHTLPIEPACCSQKSLTGDIAGLQRAFAWKRHKGVLHDGWSCHPPWDNRGHISC